METTTKRMEKKRSRNSKMERNVPPFRMKLKPDQTKRTIQRSDKLSHQRRLLSPASHNLSLRMPCGEIDISLVSYSNRKIIYFSALSTSFRCVDVKSNINEGEIIETTLIAFT